jgi:hypothetical protein
MCQNICWGLGPVHVMQRVCNQTNKWSMGDLLINLLSHEILTEQVLLACMRCPGGKLLTNDNVINIFQACFRIGHYQTERSKDMSGAQLAPSYTSVILSRRILPPYLLHSHKHHGLR